MPLKQIVFFFKKSNVATTKCSGSEKYVVAPSVDFTPVMQQQQQIKIAQEIRNNLGQPSHASATTIFTQEFDLSGLHPLMDLPLCSAQWVALLSAQ